MQATLHPMMNVGTALTSAITANDDPVVDVHWGNAKSLLNLLVPGIPWEAAREEWKGIRGFRIDLPEEIGSGQFEYLTLERGLVVLIMNCNWSQPRHFRVFDGGAVRFNFGLDLDVAMSFGKMRPMHADRPSWRIIHMPDQVPTVEHIPQRSHCRWVTICCPLELISELSGIEQDNLPHPIRWNQDSDDRVDYCRAFELNHLFSSIAADMVKTPLREAMRLSYIRSKVHELIILALDHVINVPALEESQIRLTQRDKATLAEARKILDAKFVAPPSIHELSRKIGINRNKLFYGFKSLFGSSISAYLQNRRLEEAYRLLTESDIAIADVAASVGFQHQCNFSTAIKERFGVTPSVLRRKGEPRQQ